MASQFEIQTIRLSVMAIFSSSPPKWIWRSMGSGDQFTTLWSIWWFSVLPETSFLLEPTRPSRWQHSEALHILVLANVYFWIVLWQSKLWVVSMRLSWGSKFRTRTAIKKPFCWITREFPYPILRSMWCYNNRSSQSRQIPKSRRCKTNHIPARSCVAGFAATKEQAHRRIGHPAIYRRYVNLLCWRSLNVSFLVVNLLKSRSVILENR